MVQGVGSKIGSVFDNLDPSKLFSGPNPLETKAADSANMLTTPSAFGQAQDLITRGAGAAPQSIDRVNIADSINSFMNPYLKDVVDTSLADFDAGAGQARAQGALARAADSTFGGSSGALQAALSEGELARGRGSLAANLRSGAYNTALGAAQQQAALDLQQRMSNANFGEQAANRNIVGGGALANLGTAQNADARANIGAQATMGGVLRDIQNQQSQAPIMALLQQIGALQGLPLDLFRGMTTNSSGTASGTTKTTSGGFSWSPKDGFSFGG